MFRSFASALVIVCLCSITSLALAEDRVKAVVFDLDTSDPQACQKLKAFLKEKKVELNDKKAEDQILAPACTDTPTQPLRQTIVLMVPNEKDKANLLKISLDATGGLNSGNSNFAQIGGTFALSKRWIDRHAIDIQAKGAYRSDKVNESTANLSGEYFFMLSTHWAVFSTLNVVHDGTKKIDFGTNEIAGVKFNFLPYTNNKDDPAITLAVGLGHRFEDYSDGTDRNTSIVSYRAKLSYDITNRMRLITALWYQHLLYGENNADQMAFFDMADFRVLLDTQLKVFLNKPNRGWSIVLGLENEYFSKPPVDRTKKNDLRTKLGVGYTW